MIPSSYHPYFGGVEEHTRHVAAELHRRGFDVEVWTPDRGERLGSQRVDGLRVRYLPTPLPARRLRSLAGFAVRAPASAAAWLDAYRRFRPDILHVQCFGPNGTYAMGLSELLRRPLVVSSHGETFMDDHEVFNRSALQRQVLRAACARADAVTACSSVVADDLRKRFGSADVSVVPNGVVLGRATPSRAIRRDEWIVLAAGRLVDKKGFDLLIRAASALPPRTRLQIVGEGPERARLERLGDDLGMKGRVDFFGRTDAAEVQRLMSQADVVVVPSRVEAFGIVVLEAWASGTPLVATNRGGPAGIVTDGVDGVLADPEDTQALSGALAHVLNDRAAAQGMAERGRETVRQYTWERVVDDYERTYASVLSGRSASRARPRRSGRL